ncbi:MAG: hypothetical protein HY695_33985 [Deltaproteobacteria bacterium]|nr:hypothetical protein [Deltaproteobacteria bacterium]
MTQLAPNSRQIPSIDQQTQGSMVSPYSLVTIRYLEKSPILVRGPATGRQYHFSGARSVQCVDVRDAEALLLTRFFRRVQ